MLKSRLITAVVLISGFLLAVFNAQGWLWGLFCLSFTLIGAYEWARLLKLTTQESSYYLLFTSALAAMAVTAFNTKGFALATYYPQGLLLLAAVVWLVIVPSYLFLENCLPANKIIRALVGSVVLVANLVAFLGLHAISPWLLLSIIATVSIADSAAYFGGKQFGKHKLAPSISPGKTWEGVMAAVFAVSIYAFWLNSLLNYSGLIVLGLMSLVALSVIGDLFESKLKRQSNVKDSGNILPGHGGILDRIDGVMPAVTLTYAFISLLLQQSPQ